VIRRIYTLILKLKGLIRHQTAEQEAVGSLILVCRPQNKPGQGLKITGKITLAVHNTFPQFR